MSEKDTPQVEEEVQEENYDDLFDAAAKARASGEDYEEVLNEPEAEEAKPDTDETDAAQEAGEVKAEEGDGAADAEATQDEQPAKDWREALSDVAKGKFDELERRHRMLEHKYKSDAGRVSAFQKQVNELKKTVKELQSAKPKEIELPPIETSEDLDAFAKEYPTIAEAAKGYAEAYARAILGETATPTTGDDEADQPEADDATDELSQEEMQELHRGLVREVSNYQQIIGHPFWQKFLEDQPPSVQRLAASNDLEDLVALFKDHYDPYFHKHNPPKQDVDTKPVESGDSADEKQGSPDTSDADDISKRRAQALKDTAVDTKQPRAFTDEEDLSPGSYEQLFNKVAREKRKERLGL